MKYLLTTALIVSFVGVGLLGFAVFGHDMNSSHNTCVGFSLDRTICPENIVGMTLHHLSTLQTLTLTMVPSSSSWLLLASLFLVSLLIFLFYKNLLLLKLEFLRERLRDLILRSLESKQRIVSWLSLLELSPAL